MAERRGKREERSGKREERRGKREEGRGKREVGSGKREERRGKREEEREEREVGSGKRDRDGWTDGWIQRKFRRFKYNIMVRKKRNETIGKGRQRGVNRSPSHLPLLCSPRRSSLSDI
jgi:hypothetical protein